MVTNQLQRQVYTLFADSSSFCSAKFQNKKFFILFWDICGNFCAKMRERKEIWFVFLLLRFCIFSRSMGRGGRLHPAAGWGLLFLEEGGTVAPHISFSLAREKEMCRSPRQEPRFARLRSETRLRAQARYKEKENMERLSWRKLLLFRLYLRPEVGFPGAVQIGFTFCAADADGGAGGQAVALDRHCLKIKQRATMALCFEIQCPFLRFHKSGTERL